MSTPYCKHLRILASFALTLLIQPSYAHNQSPAVIRKSMVKVYAAFNDAPLPKNLINGKAVQTSSGKAQLFDVIKDGQKLGYSYQIEINEEVYTVGISTVEKKIIAVVKAGSTVPESEWGDLSFLKALKENALGTK